MTNLSLMTIFKDFISFVHDKDLEFLEADDLSLEKIKNTTDCANRNVAPFLFDSLQIELYFTSAD